MECPRGCDKGIFWFNQEKVKLARKLIAEGATQARSATPAVIQTASTVATPAKSTPALTGRSPSVVQLFTKKVSLSTAQNLSCAHAAPGLDETTA